MPIGRPIFVLIKNAMTPMRIDLEKLIQKYSLDKKVLEELLFPLNKHQALALRRAIIGDTSLVDEQISKLASLIGVSRDALYVDEWKHVVKGTMQVFESEDYRAELNMENNMTRIYHKGSLKHTAILHNGAISLEDYFQKLNSIIKTF